jgi:hypothetical protein
MIPAKSTIFPLFASIISRRHVFLAVEKQCDNRLSIFCLMKWNKMNRKVKLFGFSQYFFKRNISMIYLIIYLIM